MPSEYSTCSNSDCVLGRHSLMSLINEKVNTLKSKCHCMVIINNTIYFTNKVPIDASDQPVYAILKEVQIRNPSEFGPEKYIHALRDLHMEHTGLLDYDNFIKGSGLDTPTVLS